MLNVHYWTRRLVGRPPCNLGPKARLSTRARILNATRQGHRIVIGSSSVVEGELFVFGHGGTIEIGDWCYVGPDTRIWSAASIKIGDRVLISHGVNVLDNLTHPVSPRLRHEQFREIATWRHPRAIDLGEQPIVIQDDAWVGAGALVLRGVTIGARAVVGAGSVVTRDVPPETIVVGNPARVLRALSAEELA